MAGKGFIPIRPSGKFPDLQQDEMSCLTWMVLSGCTRREAFLTFCRPDMAQSKAKMAVDEMMKQFYARQDVRDYLEAYSETLSKFIGGERKAKQATDGQSMDERRSTARQKVVEFALAMADNIDSADDPEAVMKICDKIGLLDSIETDEAPRRYLPVTCGQCKYREFCEENAEDMCPKCRALKVAEEHGFRYDPTTLLENDGEEGK